jgi:hypothetical protein
VTTASPLASLTLFGSFALAVGGGRSDARAKIAALLLHIGPWCRRLRTTSLANSGHWPRPAQRAQEHESLSL